MSARTTAAAAPETREERIEAILNQLRPKIEATVRRLVERGVDVPEAEEFGPIDFEFRGTAFVPFKSNSQPGEPESLWQKMCHFFHYRRVEFLRHYHAQSNIESTFSALKRKFGDAVRSKHETAMRNEALCKFLRHNICCVIMEQCVLGIEAEFWPEERKPDDGPDVLRFPAV